MNVSKNALFTLSIGELAQIMLKMALDVEISDCRQLAFESAASQGICKK